jgi:hypothetical protein
MAEKLPVIMDNRGDNTGPPALGCLSVLAQETEA